LPYGLLLIVSKRKIAIALTEVDYCPGSRPCGATCAHATLSIDGFSQYGVTGADALIVG
jgi:hypothetical protein